MSSLWHLLPSPQSHLSMDSSAKLSLSLVMLGRPKATALQGGKTGGFQLFQLQSRLSWLFQRLDVCLPLHTGSIPIYFELCDLVLQFPSLLYLFSALPAHFIASRKPSLLNRINVWNLWRLFVAIPSVLWVSLLCICHIILVGFLHPTIQIKMISSQNIFVNLAWTYLLIQAVFFHSFIEIW